MVNQSITWMAVFGVIAMMFLRLPYIVARQDGVLHTYRALVEVDALARQRYVEPIDGTQLIHGAIRGVMRQLDPYSGYIAPDQLSAFLRRSRGEYSGVGVELGVRHGQLTVIAPIEGGPAALSGIRSGDTVLSIDGEEADALSVLDLEDRLAGESGTSVLLTVLRRGETHPETVTIIRAPIRTATVKGWARNATGSWEYVIEPDKRIAYIRITRFLAGTVDDFDAALSPLMTQGIRACIVDIRSNPGGLLPQAVGLVDRFIDQGVIVSTVTRRHAVKVYEATPSTPFRDLHVVILINHGSASASEIVAGALQAHSRAVVMGVRSFGKGSVQHLIHLKEQKAAIKLTTAYYRLPDGRILHRTPDNASSDSWGVFPDIEVPLSEDEWEAVTRSRRALDHAGVTTDVLSGSTVESATAAAPTIPHDRQLRKAIAHLQRVLDAS